MKTVVRVKLRTTAAQAASLARTLRLCNEAANHASQTVHGSEQKRVSAFTLHKLVYPELRKLGLPAQLAVRTIKKAADAYATLRGNLRNGRLGKPGSKRWVRATSKPIQFRDDAAQAFDDRCLSWNHADRTVSITTVDGRVKPIPYTGRDIDLERLARHRQGETDLVEHQGGFYLVATLDEPAPASFVPRGFVGVDLGIENIATTSDGLRLSGRQLSRTREKYRSKRRELQQKGTKSAKRRLKARSGREARFAKDVNHQVSKEIVAVAERTGRGIGLEELTGIRDRVRLRKPQRATHSSWAFAQLAAFLTYKAERAGVPVTFVDPAYTSQTCHLCGHRDRKNRTSQAMFACRSCGVALHADENAARNISRLANQAWGAVNRTPNADSNPTASRGTRAASLSL